MRLESAQELKRQLIKEVVEPFSTSASRIRKMGAAAVTFAAATGDATEGRTVFGIGGRPFTALPHIQRSVALGISRWQGEYRLAVRVQRPSLVHSPLFERLARQATGEIDVRIVGRIDKRTRTRRPGHRKTLKRATTAFAWYQLNTRPLLMGASVGHFDVTGGSIGAFVRRGTATFILSNNHVLANEDLASEKDWILQRSAYDGGKQPTERVAQLRFWIELKRFGANFVDGALAEITRGVQSDVASLRELVHDRDRRLAGVGPDLVDVRDNVFKIGRTTGPTEGRVTAFDLDNVIVNYDSGNLRFDHQIEIEGVGSQAFSDGGDSGALIVNVRNEAVALLFAGGDAGGANGLGLTYANPIHHVLKNLKATLLF